MKRSNMLLVLSMLMVGLFSNAVLAETPSLPCKSGVSFSKAVVGHMQDYEFKNGLVTEKQSYFKVDGEIKPNGCLFEFPKDSSAEQCIVIIMNATPGVQATNDFELECISEKDASQRIKGPSADDRKLMPVCPTEGVVGCSNNTTDLGEKAGEFYDKMKKENKVAYFGCIHDVYTNVEVGKISCSASTSNDKNNSLFQLSYNNKIRGSTTVPMSGPGSGGGLKGLFKKK